MASKYTTVSSSLPRSHVQPRLSGRERIFLVFLVPIILSKLLFNLLWDFYSDPSSFTSTRSLKRLLIKNVGLIASSVLSLRQTRSFENPTGEVVEKFCRERELLYESVEIGAVGRIEDDKKGLRPATLHVIDCSSMHVATTSGLGQHNAGIHSPLLLYFHGGGYVHALQPGCLEMALLLARAASANLAVLEYTLSPSLQYPGQLSQAVAALNYVLQARRPSEVILGGDSAGGNLLLGLLAHLKKPHPDHRIARVKFPFVQGTNSGEALKAAICISPRCSNTSTSASYVRNRRKDAISPQILETFLQNWNPVLDDVWASAVREPYTGFWRQDIPVEKVLFVAGENEVYIDDIKEMARMMGWDDSVAEQPMQIARQRDSKKTESSKVDLRICKGEYHDQGVIDLSLGIRDGGFLAQSLKWIEDNL